MLATQLNVDENDRNTRQRACVKYGRCASSLQKQISAAFIYLHHSQSRGKAGVEVGATREEVVENEQVLPLNSGDASFFLAVTF